MIISVIVGHENAYDRWRCLPVNECLQFFRNGACNLRVPAMLSRWYM
jgi:hypothetical protein